MSPFQQKCSSRPKRKLLWGLWRTAQNHLFSAYALYPLRREGYRAKLRCMYCGKETVLQSLTRDELLEQLKTERRKNEGLFSRDVQKMANDLLRGVL